MFDHSNPNITCTGYIAVSNDDEAILLVFEGTVGDQELIEENSKLEILGKHFCTFFNIPIVKA